VTDTIQQTRYDRLVRRVGGIIGPGSKVGEVISDLFPMIDVERVPGELLALMGTSLAWGSSNQGALAANVNRSQVFNPAGSGAILTVTRIDIISSVTQVIVGGLVEAALAIDTGTQKFRDSRLGIGLLPVGQVRNDTQAAPSPVSWRNRIQASSPLQVENDNGVAVLLPGTGLQVSHLNQNTNFVVGWMWRERPAEQSELNL